jgi:hypothetical protein
MTEERGKERVSRQQTACTDSYAIQKISACDRAMHAKFTVAILLTHA